MIMQRRSFLIGVGSLFIAPAIVRASSLMPVKSVLYDCVYVCTSIGKSYTEFPCNILPPIINMNVPTWSTCTVPSVGEAVRVCRPGGLILVSPEGWHDTDRIEPARKQLGWTK